MTISQIDAGGGPHVGAAGEARTAIAYRSARRHSALVRVLRVALILIVIGTILGLVGKTLWRTFFVPLRATWRFRHLDRRRQDHDGQAAAHGSRPGGGGYNITAVKAMQDAQHPGDVDLALIGGDIAMPDREVSRLSANSGHYQSADEALELAGDVRLTNSHYEIYLQSVRIQFKKGEYVSKEPVKVRILPDASITADSFARAGERRRGAFRGPRAHADQRPRPPRSARRHEAGLLFALALQLGPALAAGKGGDQPVSILPGGDSKSPISIEADKLDYFQKEGKAIYDGHVVVVQGDTKLTARS